MDLHCTYRQHLEESCFDFFLLKRAQEVEKESVVLRNEHERRELDLIKIDYIHIINHQMIKSKNSI